MAAVLQPLYPPGTHHAVDLARRWTTTFVWQIKHEITASPPQSAGPPAGRAALLDAIASEVQETLTSSGAAPPSRGFITSLIGQAPGGHQPWDDDARRAFAAQLADPASAAAHSSSTWPATPSGSSCLAAPPAPSRP